MLQYSRVFKPCAYSADKSGVCESVNSISKPSVHFNSLPFSCKSLEVSKRVAFLKQIKNEVPGGEEKNHTPLFPLNNHMPRNQWMPSEYTI